MSDIVNKLTLRFASNPRDLGADELLEAAEEIIHLRAKLAQTEDSLVTVISKSGRFAHEAGFYSGTLYAIAQGYVDDPKQVALDALAVQEASR